MASLSFIMDVDDHQTADGRPPHNKRDRGPSKPASAGPLEKPETNRQANPRHVSSPDLATEKDINQPAPAAQPKRRGPSSRGPKSAAASTSRTGTGTGTGAEIEAGAGAAPAAAISSSPSTSPSSLPVPTTRPSARRRSTTSNDSMERPGYGSAASSSTGGGPQRPMPLHPTAGPFQPRITPKTGRVSKAQKGLRVHVCNICKPPKTFTRAEHLRRHQLGHGAPQYQCQSCDRAFHRPDLLARHQQKHESEGDQAPKATQAGDSSHRASAGVPRQAQQTPQSAPAIIPGSGPGPAPSASAAELPPTQNTAVGSQAGFSQANGHLHGNDSVYRAPGSSAYSLSPERVIIAPTHPSALRPSYPGGPGSYHSPRAGPLYVVTQGIPEPSLQPAEQPPDLHDTSPWPSSASDSTYSTPSDISRNPPTWIRGHRSPTREWATSQRLSPYPSAAARGLQPSGTAMDSVSALHPPSLFIDSYAPDPQPQEQHFGGTALDVSSMGFAGTASHPSSLSGPSDNAFRPRHHRDGNSVSSLRSRTPPLSASSHAGGTLAVPLPTVTSRLDPLANLGRRKEMLMDAHPDLMGQGGMGGMDLLGGLDVGYAGGASASAASPGGDNGNLSSRLVAELDLAMGGGCAIPIPEAMAIPLPGPVRAAIPGYLEVYWERVDPLLPLIHRQSFEAAPEDALKCAMAAIATQHLDSREDRVWGNQLHEFAWQEVKRVPQWSLQVMQAILLCEYFARFRGRKAVTRPSSPFASLYSRALYHDPALFDHGMLAADQHVQAQDRWQNWVEAESRRRLLAACLVCDGHAAIYQQQRCVQDGEDWPSAAFQLVPLSGRSAALWEASSAEEWANTLAADPGAASPDLVPPIEQLTPEYIQARPPFDKMVILSVCARRLPRRQRPPAASVSASNSPAPELGPHAQHLGSPFDPEQHTRHLLGQFQESQDNNSSSAAPYMDGEERIRTLFRRCPVANTYLALHHTPLRDLLAVGGDSWVFSQKVLPATSFVEHQRRFKLWVAGTSSSTSSLAGLSSAKATVYAARAILGFLDREPCAATSKASPSAPWAFDLADYWALYVCALICWAFSHRARGSSGPPPLSSSSNNAAEPQPHQQQQQQQQRMSRQRSSSGGRSGGSSPASGASGGAAMPPGAGGANATTTEDEALGWLRMVAAEGMRLEDVVRARARREAGGVVGLVRRRLEHDCVGGRSRLYVEAVGVLRKIEEGGGWKRF